MLAIMVMGQQFSLVFANQTLDKREGIRTRKGEFEREKSVNDLESFDNEGM